MNDKSLGYSIMFVTALLMIGYFIWLLSPFSEWAYRLPILAAVYLVLFIILWIGYTMATTPPPIPLDSPLDLQIDEEKKE